MNTEWFLNKYVGSYILKDHTILICTIINRWNIGKIGNYCIVHWMYEEEIRNKQTLKTLGYECNKRYILVHS